MIKKYERCDNGPLNQLLTLETKLLFIFVI